MQPVPIQQKLAELIEMLRLIQAPPEQQLAWARDTPAVAVPPEEVALQYYDAVPMWFNQLASEGVMDKDDETRLLALLATLQEVQTRLFGAWLVPEAPEWAVVRQLACDAETGLQRWRTHDS